VKRTLGILLLLVIVAVTGDLVAPYRRAVVETRVLDAHGTAERVPPSDAAPVRLDVEAARILRVDVASPGNAVGGRVEIRATGGNLFARLHGRHSAIPLGPGYQRCSSARPNGMWSCRIAFRFDGKGSLEFAAVSTPAIVHGADVVIVKDSGVAAVGIGSLFVFFSILSLIGLALLRVKLSAATKSALLAAVGAMWLLGSGGVGAVGLLATVAGIYVLLRTQLASSGSVRRFATTLGVLVLLLVAVKVYAMNWGALFANPGGLNFGVPLGFAFFIIRALDLSFRIATREIAATSAREYFSYMLFPATLAAGPIFTLPQFRAAAFERPSIVDWTAGMARVAVGLGKKMVGDLLLARIVGPKLALLYADPLGMPAADLWALLLANAIFVYLDFSGYSDMAIGIGRQLGWRVPENFDFPLLRSSMRAFWQRWHMTLSAWVSRWVHFFTAFPLRRSNRTLQAVLPVVTCLLVIGLWHEMQLSYLAWGLHHALGILFGDLAGALAAAATLSASQSGIFNGLRQAAGIVLVWAWVALSHCFTLISDPLIALQVYGHALAFGM